MKLSLTSTLIFLIFININGFSQHHGKKFYEKNYEIIKTEKIAFFTEKINLTPSEAEKFWPVYNEYENKKREISKDKRDAMKSLSKSEELNDELIEKHINTIVNSHFKEAELIKEYDLKYKKIISKQKIAKYYLAEHKFKRYLLNKLKEQKTKQ